MTQDSNLDLLAADARQDEDVSPDRLERLLKLGFHLERRRDQAADLQAKLDRINEEIRDLETNQLPAELVELGLRDLTLDSGAKLIREDVVRVTIDDSNREVAHGYLRDTGNGDLIKNTLTIVFGKGEDPDAKMIRDELVKMRDDGLVKFGDLQQKEAVNWQTLQAWARDSLRTGRPLPADTFKLYVGQVCKYKPAA